MAKKKTGGSKGMSEVEKVGIGVGLTAAAVAAAGAYFLYGSKNAPKNRKTVKSWMLKARAEVLEALERAEHITEAEYTALVDSVGGVYSTVQSATRGEIADFKKEMKDQWKKIEKSGAVKKVVRGAVKSAAKKAKKSISKKTKKVAKSASKKKAKAS